MSTAERAAKAARAWREHLRRGRRLSERAAAGAATVTRSGVSKAVDGFSIGGGVELKASEHLRLRTEYLYDQYKSVDITVWRRRFRRHHRRHHHNPRPSVLAARSSFPTRRFGSTAILPVLTQHGWVQASGAMLQSVSQKRRTALSVCFDAIPDAKPFHTFPGIALCRRQSDPFDSQDACPGAAKADLLQTLVFRRVIPG